MFFQISFSNGVAQQRLRPEGVLHQYPLDQSKNVTPLTNIGIRAVGAIDRTTLSPTLIRVVGSLSGNHDIVARLSSDARTAVIHPIKPFATREVVRVEFAAKLLGGRSISDTFEFTTSALAAPRTPKNSELEALAKYSANAQSAPIDRLPVLNVTVDDSATPGTIYLSNLGFTLIPDSAYLFNLNEHGAIVKQQMLPGNHGFDFKIQPNGLRTYFDWNANKYYGLDTVWNVVDSFEVAAGYGADAHELRLLPDGGYALIGVETQPFDMRQMVVRGDSTAVVTGSVIQIFDRDRNQIFNWRGFDHYQVTDAKHENLTMPTIDFEHANSLDFDSVGNIILSNRHLCEVTKINGQTGDIIWRLGGAHSSFALAGDSVWFSYQHAVRLLPNGHLTLFDNSNFDSVIGTSGYFQYSRGYFQHSRALEFELDTNSWTASVVWQYHHTPETYGMAMGYVERLPNGNTLISWGADTLSITEVRPDNSTAFEMGMHYGNYSYRAIKYPSPPDSAANVMAVAGSVSAQPQPLQRGAASVEILSDAAGDLSLQYVLAQDEAVSIEVFDMLGNRVSSMLASQVESAGLHQQPLDLGFQSSGAFVCVLQTPDGRVSRVISYLNR